MRSFCLSVHAAYACRHAGACCTAAWRIPVEPQVVQRFQTRTDIALILDPESDMPYVARRAGGACVFFDADTPERRCAIHRTAGPELLPSACRHFPRVVLRDPRGTFVTLSSFCPTAAAMLQEDMPLAIVDAPASLTLDGNLEGLDAIAVLPPLLRPGVLMDYAGYTAWEHAAIAVLDRDDLDAGEAIDAIASATERVQQWTPGAIPLADHVRTVFANTTPSRRLRPGSVEGRTAVDARPLRMFLAAHLFGSWAAYQDGGLSGVVRAVRHAHSLVRTQMASGASFVEAVRAADLELRHMELR